MKRFLDYFVIRENGEAEQVKSGFEQLRTQISDMFGKLYKAAQYTWGNSSPSLSEKTKQEVITSLEGILAKIKGGEAVKSECYNISQNIEKLLIEADSIVGDLRTTGKAISGRKTYNMMDVLKNIENKIMQGVHGLEQSVLGQKLDALKTDLGDKTSALQGHIGSNHADMLNQVDGVGRKVTNVGRKVIGVDKKVAQVGSDVNSYGQQSNERGVDSENRHKDLLDRITGVEDKVSNPPTPLSYHEEDAANTSIGILKKLIHIGKEHEFKLTHPATRQEIDLSSLNTSRGGPAIFNMARKDKTFSLSHKGDPNGISFSLGDPQQVEDAISSHFETLDIDPLSFTRREKGERPYGAVSGNQTRKLGLRDANGKVIRPQAESTLNISQQECVREWLGLNVGEK